MNLLLDTHALLWWLAGHPRLGREAHALIADPGHNVYVSAATAWEIAIKASLGKLVIPPDVSTWLPYQLESNRFVPLPITVAHALGVARLPPHHTDPFDRVLIAQAQAEGLTLVSSDEQLGRYGVPLIRC